MLRMMIPVLMALLWISACNPFIHGAVKTNDLERVKTHVAQGHVNDREDQHLHTPLIMACYYGYADIARYLCENGADLDAQALDGSTALIYSAYYNYYEITMLLLHHGASVNLKDKHGHTALYYAIQHDHDDVARVLKSRGGVNE